MIDIRNNLLQFVLVVLVFFSCSRQKDSGETAAQNRKDEVHFTVERAPEWTALFKRSSGWFGGDGIFAIPYSGVDQKNGPGDTVLFVFSDTMIGEIEDGKLQPGYTMVNNSMARLTGGEARKEAIEFLVARDKKGDPATVFVPRTPESQPEDYYWLGDGFVNQEKDNNLYLFAYRIQNTTEKDAQFPFREVGNVLIVIPEKSTFPFKEHRQLDIPFFSSTGGDGAYVSFGSGLLVNTPEAGVAGGDGFVYVYGVRGPKKELVTARIKPATFEDFDQWEFWDGSGWSGNSGTLEAISDSVSNELSVVPVAEDKYALIYQYGGIFPSIYMQVGPTPAGPFGPRIKVWDTKNDISDPDLFTYNAKAHPAISGPGELLVSYNVNSFKFFDVIEDKPNLYRPRFIKIKFD